MKTPLCLAMAILSAAWGMAQAETLHLQARYRPAQDETPLVHTNLSWAANQTAIVVCDTWNQHWCQGATRRVAEMAPRMNQVIEAARRQGVLIIHCPSSTMEFYAGTPQRRRAQEAPVAQPKVPLENWCHLDSSHEAPLPIDDSDGGCNDEPPCPSGSPWTRQIQTIAVAPEDAITDSAEAYNLMEQRGIRNVIVMGVHVNMCVLGRPFSIRQMVYQGKNVVLMRDLTDSMYNSRRAPYVSHCRGTELVVEHIERFWCPSITSVDFIGGEPFRFQEDQRPTVLFVIGEKEYNTRTTLPDFAQRELNFRGFETRFIHADDQDPNQFTGLETALNEADLLVLSVRRRALSKGNLATIQRYLQAGNPLVAIRTASHAFDVMPPDENHAAWPEFDREILGGEYLGHYGNKPPQDPPTVITRASPQTTHPVLLGLPSEPFHSSAHLYKNRKLAPTTTILLMGQIAGEERSEPVAWINTAQARRVFYTSLGNPDDFQQTAFQRLLLNGILWALESPVPPADLVLQSTALHSARRP